MSTFYFGRMCGHRIRHPDDRQRRQDQVSDRDREVVMASLGREWADGRLDQDEYEARAARAAAAVTGDDLRAALGDIRALEPIGRRRHGPGFGPAPAGVAAVLVVAAALVALLGLGFHLAFFWIVPLVGFKLARFHGRAGWDRRRPVERTISV
jgi:hypothetical protein